jgi:hypothetical protein
MIQFTSGGRIQPLMRMQDYITYGWAAPLATHWRRATCEEYECEAFQTGWVTKIDVSTELGQQQEHFIRNDPERSFREEHEALTLIKFTFPPGTPCFKRADHRVPIGKPPLFRVRGGDWRGSTGVIRTHVHAEDWIEDFATHQEQLAEVINRG